MNLYPVLSLGILLMLGDMVNAQEKCTTVPYNQQLDSRKTGYQRKEIFEKWIGQKREQRQSEMRISGTKEEPIYIIPVVVHVVYHEDSGIEVGNIPDEQILSQISVLNEDYRRNNPDTVNTPENFIPVAADTRIEFRLAQRDPYGAPTTGIVRLEGPKSSWNANSIADDQLLKSLSFWPPEDYMNIWVTDLSGDFLGYAQYPQTDLPGSLPPYDRETDGVVIDYQVFGSKGMGSFPGLRVNFDQGRTTTHEVGHYLGLRHIWGDSDVCGATDYCEDTPDQETNYFSCTDVAGFSCGNQDMYQNYMDYTYDVCMNIFTFDQMERMRIVMENSPRRASLLNSPALLPPDTVSNILIVREIIRPADISCEMMLDPEIRIQNIGNNPISDFEVQVTLDQTEYPVRQFDIFLETGATQELSLLEIVGDVELEKGQHYIQVRIRNVNGVDSINYPLKSVFKYFVNSDDEEFVPFREKFQQEDISNSSWVIYNPDNNITWQIGSVPLNRDPNNAAFIRMFDYNIPDQRDWLVSP
ncbi:MAG: zinc metalloprotease, partial [Cyclobacteriaceae bacterium]|nr:zinc metalloprotease [Cyclobacteriaceae bacterium]